MAQSGYTPILIYASGTATNVPLAANMTSSASGAELALNYADGKLYYKNSSGVVTLLASSSGSPAGGSNTQVQYNSSGVLAGSANMTFNGTTLTVAGLSNTGNTILGDASADTVTVNGTITSNLIFTDNTYDIGASGATRPRNLYLAGTATIGSTVTLSGGTANGVMYLNGSKQVTTGTALAFDGSALTINSLSGQLLMYCPTSSAGSGNPIYFSSDSGGTNLTYASFSAVLESGTRKGKLYFQTSSGSTPVVRWNMDSYGVFGSGQTNSAWGGSTVPIQMGAAGAIYANTAANYMNIGSNLYYDGTSNKRIVADYATLYSQLDGNHDFYAATTSTAGSTISFNQIARFANNGNIGFGTGATAPIAKLEVKGTNGSIAVTGSGYTTSPTSLLLGQYDSTKYYIQKPSGATLSFWDNATNDILQINGSNFIGFGIAPSAWNSTVWRPFQSGAAMSFFAYQTGANYGGIGNNVYNNDGAFTSSAGTLRINSGYALAYTQDNSGNHNFYTAVTGAANSNITWVQAAQMSNAGNMGVKTTSYAWGVSNTGLDVGLYTALGEILSVGSPILTFNLYHNGSGFIAKNTGVGSYYQQYNGAHFWYYTPSVTGGTSASPALQASLSTTGQLILGASATANGAQFATASPPDSTIGNQAAFISGAKVNYAGIQSLPQGQLIVYDSTASTAGSGGAISFAANSGSGQYTWLGAIDARRDSATAGNYGGSLNFYVRPVGGTYSSPSMSILSTGNITYLTNGSTFGQLVNDSGYVSFGVGQVGYMFINAAQLRIIPRQPGSPATASDNLIDLGDSGSRFRTIYAGTGSINTSDANDKQDFADITEAERRAAVAVKALFKSFRFKDAVAEKGSAARIHFGVVAQEVRSAFEAEGLDAHRYGLFCSDTWYEVNGNRYMDAREVTSADAGAVERTRLGVRYDELLSFVICAI